MTRPSVREISEAMTNQPSERAKMRPMDFALPMCAMPTTSVENTRGPISILIRRRKISEKIEI